MTLVVSSRYEQITTPGVFNQFSIQEIVFLTIFEIQIKFNFRLMYTKQIVSYYQRVIDRKEIAWKCLQYGVSEARGIYTFNCLRNLYSALHNGCADFTPTSFPAQYSFLTFWQDCVIFSLYSNHFDQTCSGFDLYFFPYQCCRRSLLNLFQSFLHPKASLV